MKVLLIIIALLSFSSPLYAVDITFSVPQDGIDQYAEDRGCNFQVTATHCAFDANSAPIEKKSLMEDTMSNSFNSLTVEGGYDEYEMTVCRPTWEAANKNDFEVTIKK